MTGPIARKIVELRMLGVAIDAGYEQQVRRSIAARAEARARWRAAKLAAKTNPPEIAGADGWLMEWILCDEDDAPFEEIRSETTHLDPERLRVTTRAST